MDCMSQFEQRSRDREWAFKQLHSDCEQAHHAAYHHAIREKNLLGALDRFVNALERGGSYGWLIDNDTDLVAAIDDLVTFANDEDPAEAGPPNA